MSLTLESIMTQSLNLHAVCIPLFSASLKNLGSVLAKGEANAKERGIDPAVFLASRLAPDMFALTRQVQIATDNAKGMAYRLAGREVPAMEDKETSFEELQARIAKVRDMLNGFKAADFAGAEAREITLKLRSGEVKFSGIDYVTRFAIPNFFFHVTTAYDILRHNGVPVGKPDFLGNR
jgi:hypothetical protein